MLLGLDHLVIAVKDLGAAARSYERLGFTVVTGGRHPEGSHNALIAFADGSYIELLAFYEPSPSHRWWAALERGGGLIDFCLASDDLVGDAARFRRAGVNMSNPSPGARRRPDGYQLRWLLAKAEGPHRGVAPFLILDETPRAERVPSRTRHANGVTGAGAVLVAVERLDEAGAWYREALGQPGERMASAGLDAEGLRFTVGPHAIELLAPRRPSGVIAAWLSRRGPSPYAVTLRAATGRKGPLDAALTQGARLTVV
jgi:catechol 2,3-dioxygenase-like lactoylglutathione lyase family enzyme